MKISVLTMFPQMLNGLMESPVVKRAVSQHLAEIEIIDIKDFAEGSFRHIDDSPYGGETGMIMRMEPLVKTLEAVASTSSHSVLLSPKGKCYNQKKAREFAALEHLILVCGHYEGTDARFDSYVDEMISVGDFILTGGEPAATVIADSVIRLLEGTLKEGVTENESLESNLLEYPQYTHPLEFRGQKVPEVLLSGNKEEIKNWKHKMAISETRKYRPDLLNNYLLDSVAKSQQDFINLMSNKTPVSENLIRFEDPLLPDMYDHNFFEFKNSPGKEEIEACIRCREKENSDFVKLVAVNKIDSELVNEFRFNETGVITMVLSDTSQSEGWKTNPAVVIKDLHHNNIGKDIIEVELRNYAEKYGEDFCLRKICRYLKLAEKNKNFNFLGGYLDGKLAGYLYTWTSNDCVGIDDLITEPEFRNLKVATTLLQAAVNKTEFAYLHAYEDETSKDMYSKLGFKATSMVYEYLTLLSETF